jgi:hypothetical protein
MLRNLPVERFALFGLDEMEHLTLPKYHQWFHLASFRNIRSNLQIPLHKTPNTRSRTNPPASPPRGVTATSVS